MREYHDLLRLVLEHGKFKADRTGTGTYSVFGAQARFPLHKVFRCSPPRSCTSNPSFTNCSGFCAATRTSNISTTTASPIWDEWADEDGNLGRVYGAQWCDWRTADGRSINQIDQVIEQIKKNPDSRRHIVSAWNVGEIDKMALPPCHAMFQFFVQEGGVELPALPTQCGFISGRAVSTLPVLRAAHADGRAGLRPEAAESSVHTSAICIFTLIISSRPSCNSRASPVRSRHEAQSRGKNIHDFKFEDFQLSSYTISSADEGADRGSSPTPMKAIAATPSARAQRLAERAHTLQHMQGVD